MNECHHRRRTGRAVLLAFLACLPVWASAAWPADQPIKIVVPQTAGGTNDTVARIVAVELGKTLKQSVIVENRPGAAGAIGMQEVARSKPDGYTLGLASDSAALLDVVHPSTQWSFERDLTGVGMIGEQPIAVAVPAKSSFKNLQAVLDAARARPDTVAFGSSGTGSGQHIIGEWLGKLAGVKLVHVPYKGGGQAMTDLAGGQIPLAVLGLAPMLAQQKGGTVRIVAITTAKRDPSVPQVPTLSELGFPQIALAQWAGIVAPAGVPTATVQKLSDALVTVLNTPRIRQQLSDAGLRPEPQGAAAFERFLKQNIHMWADLIPTLALKLQ
jgi:tripartite-type tricarboxylate transporter receptor subunit TctC